MVDLQPILSISEVPPLRQGDHGVIYVGQTRVPIDTVIEAFVDGDSAETIVDCYDVLILSEVYATLAFYLAHRNEVDSYLKDRQSEAEKIRHEIESQPEYHESRSRLLARAKARGFQR